MPDRPTETAPAPASDPLHILLAHDRWATLQVLAACDGLSGDQFHRRFDLGPGSLHDTVTHVVGAIRAWTDTLAGWEARPRPDDDGRRRTVAEIRELFEASYADLEAEAGRRPLGEQATRTLRNGRTATFTRGAILAHVTTHGMHHRAQCLNMLRQVGATPLPPSSVTEWTWLADGRA